MEKLKDYVFKYTLYIFIIFIIYMHNIYYIYIYISCSLLVNPSHTDESWEGRNTCMYIYIHVHRKITQDTIANSGVAPY